MKKLKNGSYTVECALIFPFVLFVVISLVWILIYMYDKVAVEKNLIHALMAVDYNYSMSNVSLKNEIEDRINEHLCEELIGAKDIRISVTVSKLTCTAKAECTLNIPEGIPGLSKLCMLSTEIEKKRISGAETIKEVRRLQKIKECLEGTVENGDTNGNEQAISDYDDGLLGLSDSHGDKQFD